MVFRSLVSPELMCASWTDSNIVRMLVELDAQVHNQRQIENLVAGLINLIATMAKTAIWGGNLGAVMMVFLRTKRIKINI